MTFRPMLACKAPDLTALRYPLLASPKLDGIRCIMQGGVPVSRNLKPIPNRHIAAALRGLPDGLDGELIVGACNGHDVMNRTASGVMSADGEPDFTYHVFDWVAEGRRFADRLECARIAVELSGGPLSLVVHEQVTDAQQLAKFEQECVAGLFEGVMLRDPNGPYKFGRSTVREGYLLKVKRFEDAEAVVADSIERFHNANEAKVNALGLTERSTHKANKIGTNTLGALVCNFSSWASGATLATVRAVQFELGTGFDDAQRQALWLARDTLPGKLVKFKYQALTPDGVPRFPVFLGFRDGADL